LDLNIVITQNLYDIKNPMGLKFLIMKNLTKIALAFVLFNNQ